MNTSNVRR
jgi:calpain, invertebrate